MKTGIASVAMSLFLAFGAAAQRRRPGEKGGKAHQLQPKADPEATNLLTEARLNRGV